MSGWLGWRWASITTTPCGTFRTWLPLGGPVLVSTCRSLWPGRWLFAVPTGTAASSVSHSLPLGMSSAVRFGPLTPSKSASSSSQVESGPAISRLSGPKR